MTSCLRFVMPLRCLVLTLLVVSPWAVAADSLTSLRDSQRWIELRLEAGAMLRQAPGNAEAHAALVEALWRGGAPTEALAAAEKARAAGADSAALRQSQASAFALRGAWKEVSRLLEADAAAVDAAPDTLLLFGIALREQGRLEEARQALLRFTQKQPASARGWLQLARVELDAGQPAAARTALNRLAPAARERDEALYLAARGEAAVGQPLAAVATLTRALEQAPLRASLYALRARQLANLQAWPAAAADIHSALLLGASAAEDYLLACEAARMLDDTEALAAYARAGRDAYPQRVDFLVQLVRALRESGDAAQARTLLEKGVKDFPAQPSLVLELALAQSAEGRQQEAVNTLDGLLAAQPSAQGYALRAYARLHLGDLARAGEDAGNALVLEPGLATALLVQARVALARGEPARAEAPCRQALVRAPALVWANTTCGEVALVLGRTDSARALAEQALRLSPQDAEALRLKERVINTGARP